MTLTEVRISNGLVNLDGFSKNKTLRGALKDLAREVAKYNKDEADGILSNMAETMNMLREKLLPNISGEYYIEAEPVEGASRYKFLNGNKEDYSDENIEIEYAEGHWYLYIRFPLDEQCKEFEKSSDKKTENDKPKMTRKDEFRDIVTDIACIQVVKCWSKTKMYKECTSDGYVGFQQFDDGTYGVIDDVSITFYLKNGDVFCVGSCDIIHKKSELPKQADVAAILLDDESGFTFWEEKSDLFRFYVTYDENGLIDEYRIEGPDDNGIIYDDEVMLMYSNLPFDEDINRYQIIGTIEYEQSTEIKKEITKLAKAYNQANASLDIDKLNEMKAQLNQMVEKYGYNYWIKLQLTYSKEESLFENQFICGFNIHGEYVEIESYYSILKMTMFKLACLLDKEASKFDDSVKTMGECHRILIKEYYYKNPEKCLYFLKVHKQIFVVIEKLKTYSEFEFDSIDTEYDKLTESQDSA